MFARKINAKMNVFSIINIQIGIILTTINPPMVIVRIFFFRDAGDTPYPGIRSRDLISLVKDGQRMKRPEFANDL